jgi:hypothetical protein
MVDKESPADFCTGMDLNSREPPAKMGNQACGRKPFLSIEEMGNAVEPDRMEARITEKNFHKVFRSRISVFDGTNVFLETLPHATATTSPMKDDFPILTQKLH